MCTYFLMISKASAASSTCNNDLGPKSLINASTHPRDPCCSISWVRLVAVCSRSSDLLMFSRRSSVVGGYRWRLITSQMTPSTYGNLSEIKMCQRKRFEAHCSSGKVADEPEEDISSKKYRSLERIIPPIDMANLHQQHLILHRCHEQPLKAGIKGVF